MTLPSNFPGQKRFFVSVGGDNKDPDPLQLCLLKVYCPTSDPSDGDVAQNAFIGTELPATQAQLEQFTAAPEAGTVLTGTRNLGDPTSATVLGMTNQYFSAESVSGGTGINDVMTTVSSDDRTNKRRKPENETTQENNVTIRKAKEKNEDWKHIHTKGLSVHAAWKPLVGQVLNEVKNIETAIQNFAQIPSLGNLAKLPGSILNLSSMLNSMNKNQRKQATKNMSPLLQEGFENMLSLMSTSSFDNQYVTTDRINPEIFMQNMIDLLSQVDNVSDLINTIERLQYDTSLRGLESYAKQEFSGLTANSIPSISTTDQNDTSDLLLSDIVDNSIHYFDQGYSLNIASQTYIVVSAEQSSNTITIYPKVEANLVNEKVNVYLPVMEYTVEGPYGEMTMTMDMNGNVSPNKNSSQQLQQALQAIQSIISSVQGGNKNLFGDAAGIMGQLFNRIPNNIRSLVINSIGQGMQQGPNEAHKKLLAGLIPHV